MTRVMFEHEAFKPAGFLSYLPDTATVKGLRRARERIEGGWLRDTNKMRLVDGRMGYCLGGAVEWNARLLAVFRRALPEGWAPAPVYQRFTGEADDGGNPFGTSRGDDGDNSWIASFNNHARDKAQVLQLIDRAISMEMARG